MTALAECDSLVGCHAANVSKSLAPNGLRNDTSHQLVPCRVTARVNWLRDSPLVASTQRLACFGLADDCGCSEISDV
eukprot:4943788-Amphidinium_carterae.1